MGFLLAFSAALLVSLQDILKKRCVLKEIDEYLVVFSLCFFSLPLLLILLFWTGIPEIKGDFWWALLLNGILNVFANVFYIKALKNGDVSKTVPFLAFTPLFLLITSPLIVGEFPGAFGVLGIILIVVGAYILNVARIKNGYFAPFRALFSEKGTRFMLAVAFIWGIAANLDKIGIKNSSSIFWVMAVSAFIAFIMFLVIIFQRNAGLFLSVRENPILLLLGAVQGVAYVCAASALKVIIVPYVISIKRISVVFSVIWGAILFKEKETIARLAAVLIMVLGVMFILLLG